MRWKIRKPKPKKHKAKPEHGDLRQRGVFLWIPLCLGQEWRWFERCVINQSYEHHADGWKRWINNTWNDDCELARKYEHKRECRRASMNGWSY